MKPLRIGLVVNPLAGLGGALALKGSDGEAVRTLASQDEPGTLTRSMLRVERTLAALAVAREQCEIITCADGMGQ